MDKAPRQSMTDSSREFPRFALEATVELSAPGLKATGRTANVSRGGLAANVDRAVPPGEVVTVRMSLVFDEDTFSEPLDLPARVVWCTQLAEHYQLGTAFLVLSADQRAYLDMFLRYLEEGAMRHREASQPEEHDDPFG